MRAVRRSQWSCVAGTADMSTGSVCTRSRRRSAGAATGTRRHGTETADGRPGAGRPAIRDTGIYTYYCKKLNSLKHLVRTTVAESHN